MDYLIHHMLLSSAGRYPDKEALVDARERFKYSDAARRCAALASGLRQAGVKRGDRVAIWLDTSVQQALAIFGVSHAGGVFVPINSLLFPDQAAHIMRDCATIGLITTKEKIDTAARVLETLPSLRFLISVDGDPEGEPKLSAYSLAAVLSANAGSESRDDRIGKDLAAILYTSGSTGKPKGVMLSHEQVMAGSSIVSDYLGITRDERIIGVLPLSFDAGLNQLMTAVQQGGTYVPTTFTFAREIVRALERENITGMAGVPTLWSLMVQPNSSLAQTPLPHLRYITNTGGRMPRAVLDALRQALGATRIFLMYGLTEAFRSTYLPPEELDRRPDSMGKAIPNTEILVVNDRGERCAPGEVGELVHRGPTVSMGYWGQPELTARVLRPHPFHPPELGDSEKVCYSGDLVRMDEEGFLYFVGRRDNMIKCSGYRVSPTEVEEVLYQSGKVREAAVIGIPDDTLGQVIKAYAVPRDGEVLDAAELIAFCAERVPRYMVPKVVEVTKALPKTSSGKIDYPALRRGSDV
ncbi:MAG TPA: acyl-CoA ligase (AMP-forming), exosortase A system-associated [Candidatus Binatia bacterium]|nr:acyl-CoA ligase (AMP-forming), exosortase A system-associated [Candidatus Binatia bacterium]